MPTLKSHQNMALDAYQILKDGKVDTGELARLKREALIDGVVDAKEKRVLKDILDSVDESKQSAEELEAIAKFRAQFDV